ncbi:glucosamine 6-phosphate N-acetyltransferase [Ecytonucleospora hepatopenaei]|uniref:Glucosamine 6-phosphate N-acetyltransferase n=1 Tax=Ecytonucleospora hepatopenaei TaxID=646526 RepID=A0A1W0E365_9MICR|nr:glucosamine 6-phosphate N-acetyltransferase [Ecytonucleospora hepatopenaei]
MLLLSILCVTCASSSVAVDETFNIRELTVTDVQRPEFLELFNELTTTEKPSNEKIKEAFEKKQSSNLHHQLGVFTMDGSVIGTLTVFLDPKYAKNGRPAAFIEDVIVNKNYQGKGLAKRLLREAEEFSIKHNSYKMILSCSKSLAKNENSPYVKLGFEKDCITMRKNLNTEEDSEMEILS